MNPVLVNPIKAVLICEIEEDENPISFLEIVLGEGKKLLLPSSIPNAHTNILLVDSYEFLLEVESKSRGVKVTKGFYLTCRGTLSMDETLD
jgi:5-formyltetrahydrofolate cyclo-ligase